MEQQPALDTPAAGVQVVAIEPPLQVDEPVPPPLQATGDGVGALDTPMEAAAII